MIKISLVTRCPNCGHKMDVVALRCPVCGTGVTGQFVLDEFFKLSEEQMSFIKTFLKHKGNLSEVQKELDISYPTARNRLNEIVKTLGYDVEDEDQESEKDVLEKLKNGEIDVSSAISMLKGGKYEGNKKI